MVTLYNHTPWSVRSCTNLVIFSPCGERERVSREKHVEWSGAVALVYRGTTFQETHLLELLHRPRLQ
jgi:hypothetical protein